VNDWRLLTARTISALVCLLGGGALQIGLWKSPDKTYFDALTQHPYLWIVYLLLALLVGEHSLRLMRPKR
jgi:hypothetical protein